MRITLQFCTVLLASCVTTVPSGGHEVTPQRPTLSSDTNTTAEGTVELEAGMVFDPSDQWSGQTVLKYGTSERTEVYVGWVPFLYDDERHAMVIGDSQLGIRHRFDDGGRNWPSAAVQASVNLPTGNEALGSAETDFSLAGIASGNAQDFGWTGFGSVDLRGDPTGAGVDPGFSLALAGSYALPGDVSPFFELAGIIVPEQDVDVVFATLGSMFSVSPVLAFDAGFVIGLSDEAPDFAFVIGFTRNFGRVRAMGPREFH
jgi:hypothetical protein